MIKMLLTVFKIDESKMPKAEEITSVFESIKDVPAALERIEEKLDRLLEVLDK